MPIVEVCDECYAKAGTCNCYDWDSEKIDDNINKPD